MALTKTASAQQASAPSDAQRIADEATETARAGKFDEALRLYKRALDFAPGDISILRDYAVVLGWAEKYADAIPVIRKVLSAQSEQPDWALREFARSLLFGDATEEALQRLNQLVERGDFSEGTLARELSRFAGSAATMKRQSHMQTFASDTRSLQRPSRGLPMSLLIAVDCRKLWKSWTVLQPPCRANQTLSWHAYRFSNWMGRHYEAQRLIADLPGSMAANRDILKESVLAERWGGNPSAAMRELVRLESLYPDQRSRDLLRELRTEYGHALTPSFRYSKDSDGLVDRTVGLDAAFHINPSHVIRTGYQYRWMQQNPQEAELSFATISAGADP
jgi:tetratricopeptide (TPR) repeat protein